MNEATAVEREVARQKLVEDLTEGAQNVALKQVSRTEFFLLLAGEFLKDFISGPDSWRRTVHARAEIAARSYHASRSKPSNWAFFAR